MATKTLNIEPVQCNLVLEKQMEHGDLKLIWKGAKLVQCKPSQCNVHTSTKDLAHSHNNLILSTEILAAILRKNSHNSN